MKNVMIYNKISKKPRWSNEELFNSFKAQIDISLARGWKKEDLTIEKTQLITVGRQNKNCLF